MFLNYLKNKLQLNCGTFKSEINRQSKEVLNLHGSNIYLVSGPLKSLILAMQIESSLAFNLLLLMGQCCFLDVLK